MEALSSEILEHRFNVEHWELGQSVQLPLKNQKAHGLRATSTASKRLSILNVRILILILLILSQPPASTRSLWASLLSN